MSSCAPRPDSVPAAPVAKPAVRPSSVRGAMAIDRADSTLAETAVADGAPELRLAALLRLEELGAPEVTSIAAELAKSSHPLLADNAVAVLARQKTPRAEAAIAELGSGSQALARALMRGGK